MKAHFKYMVKGYSGKCDGLVYYYNSRIGRTLARKIVKPTQTEQNVKIRTATQNLAYLQASEGYKQDLSNYAGGYSKARIKNKSGLNTWFNAFIMLMWAMAKQMNINIATITKEQIINSDLPCRTVKQAVDAGLLPLVKGYEEWTNQM
jgi:hypothetical protein